MNIDECFEIADYLQQTEPVDYEEQRKGASAIWWLIEQNRQQQAEIEALKAVLKEAINGMGHSHQAKFKEYLK